MTSIIITSNGPITHVQLNRPEVKNAFNEELIKDLTDAFGQLAQNDSCRVVVLSGAGGFFCAGGDLKWMKSFAHASDAENEADARRLAGMLEAVDQFPKPVVGQVAGGAFGGGVGLVSVCDVVMAAEGTLFSLSEVKLGLIPAVISPYVIAKTGVAPARRYFLTGERFDAGMAQRIGLVHELTKQETLEERTLAIAREFLSSGPEAVRACKALIRKVRGEISPAIQTMTSKEIARLRASPEGQEGMRAFLEKRRPFWLPDGKS